MKNPSFLKNSKLKFVESKKLFQSSDFESPKSPSIIKLDSGKLILLFSCKFLPIDSENSTVMISESENFGKSWSTPKPVMNFVGWDCISMGGLAHISDDHLVMIIGRIKIDHSLGGDEPFSGFYTTSKHSFDQGKTWSEETSEIKIFPFWTELYGTSNPHLTSTNKLMWACMGTKGRDEGWHAGITFSSYPHKSFETPIIIAEEENRNFSDIDILQLSKSHYLSVIREHITKNSVSSYSIDGGKTWSKTKKTGFQGANIKLLQLSSGAIICTYRNENLNPKGISISQSKNNGKSWDKIGQLYEPDDDNVAHEPGSLCGYPDMIKINKNEILCFFHTYPDKFGKVSLQQTKLLDLSSS